LILPYLLNKLLPIIAFSVLLLVPIASQNAFAELIYESATLGPTGQTSGGFNANEVQMLGSRFSISETMEVSQIGGHMYRGSFGANPIFGAIVELSGPNAFPLGDPFTGGEVLAFTTFPVPVLSTDVSVPLSITLQPGDYALIFGAGALGGTNGEGVMTVNNFDTPEGLGSYFFWQKNNNWRNGSPDLDNSRFTVNGLDVKVVGGELIPIDTTSLLVAGASSSAWMIPVVLSILGIGLFAFTRKSE